MQNIINTNIELIESIKENINDPYLVLDQQGRILSFNNIASAFFSFSKGVENFYELLEHTSIKKMGELLHTVFTESNTIEEDIILNLNSGKNIRAHLIISRLIEKDEKLAFCLFRNINNDFKKTSLKIKIKEIDKIINNKEVLSIIEEVKASYPFTFISKNLVRKSADKLKVFFWLKNIDGSYLLVNDKVSASIGLNTVQIEGRKESNFIPHYLVNFQKSIDQYIVESANCTIIDGLQFGGLTNPDEYETIEIPLLDQENKIIAIAGIGQKKPDKKETFEINDKVKDLLDHVSCAIAFIDPKDMISFFNTRFSLHYGNKFFDLKETEYFKLFPSKAVEKISKFISSSSDETSFEFNDEEKNYFVKLKKIFNNNLYSGTSISIEEKIPDVESTVQSGFQVNDRILYDNPFPVLIFNKENLKFLEVNDAALQLYGYSKDEFLNLDLTDLYTEDDMQTLLELTTENIQEGVFNGPYKHKKKDGSNILIEMSKISIIYKGKDAGLNVLRDITKKVEHEKNSRIYKAVFEHTDSLLFLTDDSGFITFINNEVTNVLGYSIQELEKTSFTSLFEDDKRAFVSSEIFKSTTEKTISFSGNIKNSENELSSFKINAVPVFNFKNETDSFVILAKLKKETEIKSAQQIDKNETLDNGTSVLDNPSILSGLFHEILTPINVILGFVRELTESVEVLTPEQKEASDIINQNRIRLLNIMNTIIDYINISDSSIKLNIKEIKITNIIDNVQMDINDLGTQKNFELSYGKISSSLVFSSDEQKMQNLIYLLLLLTMNGENEKKIYFSAFQFNDENFILILKDNYSFTSNELIEKLNATIYGNNGDIKNYGISKFTILLIKKLLRLLKGSVKIVEENGNKEFGFVFPLDLAKYNQIKTEPDIELDKLEYIDEKWLDENFPVNDEINENINKQANEAYEGEIEPEESDVLVEETHGNVNSKKINLSELKCLYIEDQIDSQILFSFQMSELEEIKFASSLEEAIPILEQDNFDFILLDINLQGDYNGIDALKYIHKIPGFESTPIIAATAYLLPGDKEKFIATGFNDFISKPIFHDNMVESLSKLF
ncbi:MAG: PAS domain S-box protein [Ignavibacteriaceae bacterium]